MSIAGRQINHPITAIITGSLVASVVYLSILIGHTLTNTPIHITKPVDTNHNSGLSVSQPVDESLTNSNLLRDLNAERQRRGLPLITEDVRLDQSAAQKASELKRDGLGANPHINPATGVHGFQYARMAAGCSIASEDISNDYTTSNSVVGAWVNSPAHLASITGNYGTAGVSINGNIVVLHLCKY